MRILSFYGILILTAAWEVWLGVVFHVDATTMFGPRLNPFPLLPGDLYGHDTGGLLPRLLMFGVLILGIMLACIVSDHSDSKASEPTLEEIFE